MNKFLFAISALLFTVDLNATSDQEKASVYSISINSVQSKIDFRNCYFDQNIVINSYSNNSADTLRKYFPLQSDSVPKEELIQELIRQYPETIPYSKVKIIHCAHPGIHSEHVQFSSIAFTTDRLYSYLSFRVYDGRYSSNETNIGYHEYFVLLYRKTTLLSFKLLSYKHRQFAPWLWDIKKFR